jgi:hypothetical protein
MRRASRTDANHAAIVAALRQCGATVVDTSPLPGFVDLVAGYQGTTVLIEVKRPPGPRGGVKGRQLTPDQRRLHESARTQRWDKGRGNRRVFCAPVSRAPRPVTLAAGPLQRSLDLLTASECQ